MSPDQVTYVLVALIVTGVAILLLLAGTLVARRGRGPRPAHAAAGGQGQPLVAPSAPPAVAPSTPVPGSGVPAAPVAGGPLATAALPGDLGPQAAGPGERGPGHDAAEESAAVTAADLEAAARRVHDPREEEIIEGFLSISPRRRETSAFEAGRGPTASGPAPAETAGVPAPAAAAGPAAAGPAAAGPAAALQAPAAETPPAGSAAAPGPPPPDPYVDEATGLDSRAAWDRVLAEENARYVRYRRPVGVVVAELDGLGRFDAHFGPEASRRILAAVGGALRSNARRTDRVAYVGRGRYLVLLPETDEIQAINYVERVRAETERWLEAGAVALRLSMGWASPSAVGELDTALRTAEERMYAERRRAARSGSVGPDGSR